MAVCRDLTRGARVGLGEDLWAPFAWLEIPSHGKTEEEGFRRLLRPTIVLDTDETTRDEAK